MNGAEDHIFEAIADDNLLTVNHNDMPIYIPFLKSTLTMGHFVVVSPPRRNSFVGQIIRRVDNVDQPQHFVTVVPYLPLYSPATAEYINNPTTLPRAITHFTCHQVIELVKTSCTTVTRISDITGLAFVFLAKNVSDFTYHLHGMQNAFVIRYKFSHAEKSLIELNTESFHCFPDQHPSHREFWCECYGRSIYTSIDHLRQEFWRVLCRYGESQGMYPKQTKTFFFPTVFTQYLCTILSNSGVPSKECYVSEPQRRIEVNLLYRMVSTQARYLFYSLDSEEKIGCLTRITGSMSAFGVRKRIPTKKNNSESIMRLNDIINVIEKIELHVNASRVKVRLFAFRHQVGQPTTCVRIRTHIGDPAPQENQVAVGIQPHSSVTLRVGSAFDFLGQVYKVITELPDSKVLCKCVWGSSKGNEVLFEKLDVIRLVNEKRG